MASPYIPDAVVLIRKPRERSKLGERIKDK
jgi:hypothetical protein